MHQKVFNTFEIFLKRPKLISFFIKQTVKTKECLWFTNSKPITSASNRSVKLIIQKTQKMCRIITLITKNVDNNPHLDLCRNQIKIETTYPADLHRIKSNCIKINQFSTKMF